MKTQDSNWNFGKNTQKYTKYGKIHTVNHNQAQDCDQSLMLRKKMHKVLSENYELKEYISKLNTIINELEIEKQQFQEEIKILMQDISNIHEKQKWYNEAIKKQQQNSINIEKQKQYKYQQQQNRRRQTRQLKQYCSNLQLQNKMLIELKEKYMLQHSKVKNELEFISRQKSKINEQKENLKIKLNETLLEKQTLNQKLGSSKEQLLRMQIELNKYYYIFEINNEYKQQYRLQMQNILKRVEKYKKKSIQYKLQRDQLLLEIQKLKIQVDCVTLRSYQNLKQFKQQQEQL